MLQYILDSVSKLESGCWEWKRFVDEGGYGMANYRGFLYAHTLSYTAFVEEIPNGLAVYHTCDNKKCCNPEHLFTAPYTDKYTYTTPEKE